MRSIVAAGLLAAAVAASGCAATVTSDAYGPDLVYVSPGVQVIADYHEPIFYSDGYYWRLRRGRLVPIVALHGRLGLCAAAGRGDARRPAPLVRSLSARRLGWPARVRRARAGTERVARDPRRAGAERWRGNAARPAPVRPAPPPPAMSRPRPRHDDGRRGRHMAGAVTARARRRGRIAAIPQVTGGPAGSSGYLLGQDMDEHFASILKGFAGVAIPLAAFATGLTAANKDPLWLTRHPGLLLRSLLVILLIVPVGVVLFLQAVGAPAVVKAGLAIAVISIGIGPPAMFQKAKQQKQDENVAYEIGLNVTLLVLAIFYVPLAVGVYGAAFGYDTQLGVGQVAKVVLTRALIPLLLGLLVGRLLPRVVKPISRYGGMFAMVVLLAIVVVALIASWRGLIGLGARTWLICAAIVIAEIVVGHLVGRGDPNSRTMLVAFTTMRFPALALLLASITRHRRSSSR